MSLKIFDGSIEQAIQVSKQIPEFHTPYERNEYENRLQGNFHCILIACIGRNLCGFKVGYELKDSDLAFYSWLGGVVPKFRQKGVAQSMQDSMEIWCKRRNFTRLRFKTRNSHVKMIHFGLKNGFYLVDLEKKSSPQDNRLWFEKELLKDI